MEEVHGSKCLEVNPETTLNVVEVNCIANGLIQFAELIVDDCGCDCSPNGFLNARNQLPAKFLLYVIGHFVAVLTAPRARLRAPPEVD